MEDCKEEVEIAMRAVVLDVTPDAEGTATEAATLPGESGEAPAEETAADAAEAAPSPDPELVAQGEAAFRQCKACHQVGEGADHRVGPHLNGVIGRTAGTAEGFRYSAVMAEAGEEGLVWTAETLHDFLSNPRSYMEGTKMSFAGFRNEGDVEAVTAYLSTFEE
jgi:cytochrome c